MMSSGGTQEPPSLIAARLFNIPCAQESDGRRRSAHGVVARVPGRSSRHRTSFDRLAFDAMLRRDAAGAGSAVWPRRRDESEITFGRLQKFWRGLSPQAQRDLLKLDRQTLTEHARRNSYCSRCNGLLLDCFAQIAMYGNSQRRGGASESRAEDPSVHPWGGLSATKEGSLTLLDCFVKAASLTALQNVLDNALAREKERKLRYPDACSAGGRGYGTREMCALHTARPSCDALEDFWSPLDEETRSSLLRMKEEDFIEKLTRRFDKKKFCRDCRKNVIREFKELKEPKKRVRRERRCSCWFCVENGFRCEAFENGVTVDWSQCLSSEADGSFHHFEWAIGTREGEPDIFGFEDVGTNARVHKTGIDLVQLENYFITLRAWRSDDRCTEYCVKAHVLKGTRSCVQLQHALVVGDGCVAITSGGSVRGFFERAEKVEEEDEDVAASKDGNDLAADGSHTQKHAKTPELAREFLLDAASVIFKEQAVKAYRDRTAHQNAKCVFISLALKLLEERVHVACKELITLEKQNKLLEEEEKEMREEQNRRMKRRTKDKEKKHRQKQRLKEKGKGAKLVETESPDDTPSPALNNSSASSPNHESTDTSPGRSIDQSSCRGNEEDDHCNGVADLSSPTSCGDCSCTSEQSADSQEEPGETGDSQWQPIQRKRRGARSCSCMYPMEGHVGSSPQKSAVPKQVWEPVDAREKTGSHSTDNAPGSAGNLNPLRPLDSDASGRQTKSASSDQAACRNGERGRAAASSDHGTHRTSNARAQDAADASDKVKPVDASFSLFQYRLPIGSPSRPRSSGDDESGGFAGGNGMPLAQVLQAPLCSTREQAGVKEYKLFSAKHCGVFSFMEIQ